MARWVNPANMINKAKYDRLCIYKLKLLPDLIENYIRCISHNKYMNINIYIQKDGQMNGEHRKKVFPIVAFLHAGYFKAILQVWIYEALYD